MTESRVPAGVPTGGQFASTSRDEASLRLVDDHHSAETAGPAWKGGNDAQWRLSRDPYRPLLPGLTEAEDSQWRDLDAHLAALRPEDLDADGRERYLDLAARVDLAARAQQSMPQPSVGIWLPSCPRHGGDISDYAAPDAGTWGADQTCSACTDDTGAARPLADRLSVLDRLSPDQVLDISARRAERDKQARDLRAARADDALDRLGTLPRHLVETYDGDECAVVDAYEDAMSRARADLRSDGDHDRYADALDRVAANEGKALADLAYPDPDVLLESIDDAARAHRQSGQVA